MKYFFDTEFIEGKQKTFFGTTKPTIDLISIGIIGDECDSGRKYYAISKDFNLKEAWNRFDLDYGSGDQKNYPPKKIYWIRDNVLKPIFDELYIQEAHVIYRADFNYKNLKRLVNKYGKTNKQIADEIIRFCYYTGWEVDPPVHSHKLKEKGNIEFYAYFAGYDWVVFCWNFGKMIDLPDGFPMYCRDLKQMLDEKIDNLKWLYGRDIWGNANRSITTIGEGQHQSDDIEATFEQKLKVLKELEEYPKQTNKHNALSDAIWNRDLYMFLKSLPIYQTNSKK